MRNMKTGLLLFLLSVILLFPQVVMAADGTDTAAQDQAISIDTGQTQVSSTTKENDNVIEICGVTPGAGDALIQKIGRMANALHQAAARVAIPITLIVVIIGGFLGMFWEAARKMILFAGFGLVLILWGPMIVSAAVNWINM